MTALIFKSACGEDPSIFRLMEQIFLILVYILTLVHKWPRRHTNISRPKE
jgi:hypothetical protein